MIIILNEVGEEMLQKKYKEISQIEKFQDINEVIEGYMPMIIKTISETTGKYVSAENSEELSIGLMAFVEAIERYEETRGEFTSFAKLIIKSRVINYLKKENKHQNVVSIDALKEQGIDILDTYIEPAKSQDRLKEELDRLRQEIKLFGFGFDELVEEAPKHKDTRDYAINVSEKVSKEEAFTTFMYAKKRLPVTDISRKFSVTEKILKRSKKFIISVVIIFYKNLNSVKLWLTK